jgi:branched-subunit amino acid ABC-type transport system permease component
MFYLQLAVAGLLTGAAYALSSVGMVAIYKGTRTINFAQGAFAMIGAYIYANWVGAGKNMAVGIVLGILAAAIAGLLTYIIVIVPLRRASGLVRLVATFGVALLLEGYGDLRWGSSEQSVGAIFTGKPFKIGSILLDRGALYSTIIAIAFTLALFAYFSRTKTGRATEAASIERDSAERLGYNVTRLGALSWLIGSVAAGATGILIVPTLGLDETGLTVVVVYALVGALVGSFQRIWWAVAGSFVIGIAQAMIDGTSSIVGLDQAAPLVAVAILLVVGAEAIPSFAGEREWMPVVPRRRPRTIALTAAVVVAVVTVIYFNLYWQSLIVQGAGMAIIALSLVLVVGYLGQITLLQWSLAGIGAFAAASLAINHHLSFLLSLLAGGLCSAVVAFVVGLPALRLRGISLAVITLSACVTIETLVLNDFNSGSGYSVPAASIGGHALSTRALSIVSIVLLAIVACALFAVRKSWYGQVLLAIRSSERAAVASGVRTFTVKILVFTIGGFLAGLGGVLWSYGTGTLQPTSFDPISALLLVGFVYLNGIGSVGAAIIAGFSVAAGSPFLTNILHINGYGWFSVLGGIGLVLTLILHPDGALVREGEAPRNGPFTVARHALATRARALAKTQA